MTSHPKSTVTPGAVCDRYNLLIKKVEIRLNRKERASGISDDNSELDNLLEEILERKKAAKEKLDNDDEDKKKYLANEKVVAEDMRKCALERVEQTAKRKGKEEGARKREQGKKSPSGERVERAQVKQWNISRKEPLKRYSYYAEAARTAAADDDDDDDHIFQSAATTITGFTFLYGKNCSKAKVIFIVCSLDTQKISSLCVVHIFYMLTIKVLCFDRC